VNIFNGSQTKLILAGATGLILCGAMLIGYAMIGQSTQRRPCPMPDDAIGSFVRVEGGGFTKSASAFYPEEGRAKKLYVSPFRIQAHEVTNDQFAAFAAATGYVAEAEQNGGSARFVQSETPGDLASWWRLDAGATWKTPQGRASNLAGKGRHPVVHVTLNDARAYATWAGGRIPNEIEWEYAASLGLFDTGDPLSGVRGPKGEARANIWQGAFPLVDTGEDGFAGTAPVGCFPKSLIGAYDMIGNAWEWTESSFGAGGSGAPRFTIKGGSYLCSRDYCRRYRTAARQGLEYDFSTAHVGFRIVKDVE